MLCLDLSSRASTDAWSRRFITSAMSSKLDAQSSADGAVGQGQWPQEARDFSRQDRHDGSHMQDRGCVEKLSSHEFGYIRLLLLSITLRTCCCRSLLCVKSSADLLHLLRAGDWTGVFQLNVTLARQLSFARSAVQRFALDGVF